MVATSTSLDPQTSQQSWLLSEVSVVLVDARRHLELALVEQLLEAIAEVSSEDPLRVVGPEQALAPGLLPGASSASPPIVISTWRWADSQGAVPLLGIEMIYGHELRIQIIEDGVVAIEALEYM